MEGGGEDGEEKKEGEGEEEKKEDAPAMQINNPHKYDDDATDYKGFANVPALLLRQATVSPYFGDMVKAALVNWEFNQGTSGEPSSKDYLGAAGLITAGLATAETAEKEVWFSGFVGDDDF